MNTSKYTIIVNKLYKKYKLKEKKYTLKEINSLFAFCGGAYKISTLNFCSYRLFRTYKTTGIVTPELIKVLQIAAYLEIINSTKEHKEKIVSLKALLKC